MLRIVGALLSIILIGAIDWQAGVATVPAAPPSVEVTGTSLRVSFADGRVLSGAELTGATLTLVLAGAKGPQRVRFERIVPDPEDGDILLHRITVLPSRRGEAAHDLCEPDAQGQRWAFPLRGQWDGNGRRLSEAGITLACAAGGAIGKCVVWGYKPWARTPLGIDLAPYHAACVNMVRANYCGDAGTTRDGMTIDYWDKAGINRPDDAEAERRGLRFEAAWAPKGALCVAHVRVPANTSLESLGRSCAYLKPRLGPANCVAERAAEGQYGEALMFNRSY